METPEDIADRLEKVAIALVSRVRDYPPNDNQRWLESMVSGQDWVHLALLLAAAVPEDVPWRHLTRWVNLPATEEVRRLAQCPSALAYRRHLRHGETPDEGCVKAYREAERERARRRRAA